MKKIIGLTVLLVMMTVSAFAQKPTNWVALEEIRAGAFINKKVGDEYYPLTFYFDGTARSEDGGYRSVRASLNIGTPSTEKFDLNTDEGQRAYYRALPANLRSMLKDLREQATLEDISQ